MENLKVKFIDINGTRIAYYDIGEPTKGTIVFLHGWAGSKDFFRDIFSILTNGFRLLILDFPGHKDSETVSCVNINILTDIVQEFVRKLNLQDFHLVCYSMGCLVGLKYLERNQKMVGKFVNWAGLEKYSDITQFKISKKIMDFLNMQDTFKQLYKAFLEKSAKQFTNEFIYNGLKEADTDTLAMLIEELCKADLSYIPPQVQNETLVITGQRKDIHLDRKRLNFLSSSFQNGKYVEADGGEHYANDLKPAAEEIINFLNNE